MTHAHVGLSCENKPSWYIYSPSLWNCMYFELLDKIKIRNSIHLYSVHLKYVWQSTWSTQSYVHININSKMLLFPDPSYAFFLQYVCQLFSVRSIWMKAIYCFDTWNTSYILYSIKIYSEFYQRNILECLKLHNIVKDC